MGIMTLALSLFSIIPMALLLANRTFWARVIINVLDTYSGDKAKSEDEGQSVAFWGTVSEVFGNNVDDSQLPSEDNDRVQWLASVIFVFSIVCIILLIVYLACSIFLIVGAAKGRRWWLLPWIVATFLLLLAYLGGVCLSIWLFGGRVEILLLLAFAVVETAVGFYLWICIVSLFQVLSSNEWRSGSAGGDWDLKPRFSTSYNTVPTNE